MTRDGFTLLVMGYTGELAMRFKEAYIKQFNAIEAALTGKLMERQKGIAVRQALTKALQQSAEDARMHGHAYAIREYRESGRSHFHAKNQGGNNDV